LEAFQLNLIKIDFYKVGIICKILFLFLYFSNLKAIPVLVITRPLAMFIAVEMVLVFDICPTYSYISLFFSVRYLQCLIKW